MEGRLYITSASVPGPLCAYTARVSTPDLGRGLHGRRWRRSAPFRSDAKPFGRRDLQVRTRSGERPRVGHHPIPISRPRTLPPENSTGSAPVRSEDRPGASPAPRAGWDRGRHPGLRRGQASEALLASRRTCACRVGGARGPLRRTGSPPHGSAGARTRSAGPPAAHVGRGQRRLEDL